MLCFTQVIGRGFSIDSDRYGSLLFDVQPDLSSLLAGLRSCFKSVRFCKGARYIVTGTRSSLWVGRIGHEPSHLYRTFEFDGSAARDFMLSSTFEAVVSRFADDLFSRKTLLDAYIGRFYA